MDQGLLVLDLGWSILIDGSQAFSSAWVLLQHLILSCPQDPSLFIRPQPSCPEKKSTQFTSLPPSPFSDPLSPSPPISTINPSPTTTSKPQHYLADPLSITTHHLSPLSISPSSSSSPQPQRHETPIPPSYLRRNQFYPLHQHNAPPSKHIRIPARRNTALG